MTLEIKKNIYFGVKLVNGHPTFPFLIITSPTAINNISHSSGTNLKANNKLRTYRHFKDRFIQENYLKWENFCQRRLITKFRISFHNLEIEHDGRYFNISADH